jgi:hypothetical protein
MHNFDNKYFNIQFNIIDDYLKLKYEVFNLTNIACI